MEIALKVNDLDNVATIFAEKVATNDKIEVRDKKGNKSFLVLKDAIPYGHKVALKDLKVGDEIVKYGELIGKVTKDIVKGEHVHVHNIDSMRGRGDLA